MYTDTCKYKRGQVWFINEEPQITEFKIENHLGMAKSRPWVIISCDSSNCSCPNLTCLPLTTQEKTIRNDVFFRDKKRDAQYVLIEKVTHKDVCEFDQKGKYMYTLSDPVMSIITEKLAKHQGIELSIPDTSQLEHMIDKIIESKYAEEYTRKLDCNEEVVKRLVKKISETFNVEVNDEQTMKSETVSESKDRRCNRRYYTPEVKYQFLKDKESMSAEELQEKYGLDNLGQVYATASRFKKWAEAQNERV